MKLKTRRAAAKRFSKTANGHFKHARAGKSHLLFDKTRKRKRNLKRPNCIKSGQVKHNLKELMPWG
ncbi:50S ribosomal protein L35 [Hippea maritima]|uniref:Large ribosomal subunit protein bL35 n=1 Tax=Hippea maritima (strain ATCC 700847 / DSM 10411 / MH2) TaxID=760142 RepID=F2LY09_HIPMA|nr:50S ribosomal protein L35 [Hippea maritima]AEA33274.1 50S ribosomal protein L35 [Hippea maritima DSM 10411]